MSLCGTTYDSACGTLIKKKKKKKGNCLLNLSITGSTDVQKTCVQEEGPCSSGNEKTETQHSTAALEPKSHFIFPDLKKISTSLLRFTSTTNQIFRLPASD
jgi:hypothetical protein